MFRWGYWSLHFVFLSVMLDKMQLLQFYQKICQFQKSQQKALKIGMDFNIIKIMTFDWLWMWPRLQYGLNSFCFSRTWSLEPHINSATDKMTHNQWSECSYLSQNDLYSLAVHWNTPLSAQLAVNTTMNQTWPHGCTSRLVRGPLGPTWSMTGSGPWNPAWPNISFMKSTKGKILHWTQFIIFIYSM